MDKTVIKCQISWKYKIKANIYIEFKLLLLNENHSKIEEKKHIESVPNVQKLYTRMQTICVINVSPYTNGLLE